MSDYTVTISEALYQKVQRLADQMAQPIDEVIRQRLAAALDDLPGDLPPDERAELRALAYLSDDTLWTILREQMQAVKQERLSELADRNSRGAISSDEYRELTDLVEDGQRLMLRKAKAMELLMDRGYPVHLDDMQPVNV
jgi:hypothetical protein